MPSILRVSGQSFAIGEYVKASTLPFHDVRHQHRAYSEERTDRRSGFSVVTSEADFEDLAQQIADTIVFLVENEVELKRLQNCPGIEHATLDFGIADRDVTAQFDRFPPELLRLMGNLGMELEISRYPLLDE